ncbi:type II toxin-antitoxin system RelE/ParE family toxin [Joostella sp.]|uniref:type II toxin-antitoxin system RelE/ParE family toxin n=1 Tax=Joostella sp. TaxID=2231138 RepID=UPI003A95921E
MKSVVWSLRAIKDLEKITKFYIGIYGRGKAREIATELRKSTEILQNNNVDTLKIGAVDETFTHLKFDYRKLISHHCKITYREGNTHIYIVRVFDTRQHPRKNK